MNQQETGSPGVERTILVGMITSTKFLQAIEPIYNQKFFQTEISRQIAEWCWRYYSEYKKAPGRYIQDIYRIEEENLEESEAELISILLSSISDEPNEINVDYLVGQTVEYFESLNMNALSAKILSLTTIGRIEEAKAALKDYQPVELSAPAGVNPYTDLKTIKDAFTHHNEPLFIFPGAFGRMINSQLTRDAFIGIMGPEKRGKTWWLMEFAFRACKARRNVAFFQLGDLSLRQQLIRFHIRLANRSNKEKYCGRIYKPIVDCKLNQNDTCKKKQRGNTIGIDWKLLEKNKNMDEFFEEFEEHEICTYCRDKPWFKGAVWYKRQYIKSPLTWREGFRLGKKFDRSMAGSHLRLSCHYVDSLSVSGVESILNQWEDMDGFVPDVIVIDYADILAHEKGKELRHQQAYDWKRLRALSLERNCLVITATQTSAHSYNEEKVRIEHYSESKDKYAHVTAIIGLSQIAEEKRKGIMRIGPVLPFREDDNDIEQEVTVLQCLKIGRPFLGSY